MLSAKDGSEAAVFAVGDALTGSHGTASLNAVPGWCWQGWTRRHSTGTKRITPTQGRSC